MAAMAPPFVTEAPRTISAAIAEAGMFQVIRTDYSLCGTSVYYAAADPALHFVIREALSIASDRMNRQKRSLLDLQVYEYSRYVIKVYGRADKKTSIMPFIGMFQLGDIGKYMLSAGLNFDEVQDDPMQLVGCVQSCLTPPQSAYA